MQAKLRGEALCLEFSNTAKDRDSRYDARDSIRSYEDFVRWCEGAGIVSGVQSMELTSRAKHDKAAASSALAAALELRELILRIFMAGPESRHPHPAALSRFNDFLARAMSDSRIERTESGYRTTFAARTGSLDWPLGDIARSAAELLIGGGLDRVRICSDDRCGRLFLDRSRNRTRRWCDMNNCGNRAKARRHYQRRVAQGRGVHETRAEIRPAEAAVRRPQRTKASEVEIGSTD